MLLGGVFRGIGAGDGPMATLGAAKARHHLTPTCIRWAAAWGAPFADAGGAPDAHGARAARASSACPTPAGPAGDRGDLRHAYWQRAEDITSDAVLRAALSELPQVEVEAAFATAETEAIKDELRRRTDEAISLGIFGAPAWVSRPHLIWGQDRMAWVEAMAAGWDLASPIKRPFAWPERARAGARVDVYVDVASPFAYLGLTQVPALAAMGADVRLVPILLGALFRDLGHGRRAAVRDAGGEARATFGLEHAALWRTAWVRRSRSRSQPKFPQRTVTRAAPDPARR
jgi:2-hydroxychromene-2-carboxylate isomerase